MYVGSEVSTMKIRFVLYGMILYDPVPLFRSVGPVHTCRSAESGFGPPVKKKKRKTFTQVPSTRQIIPSYISYHRERKTHMQHSSAPLIGTGTPSHSSALHTCEIGPRMFCPYRYDRLEWLAVMLLRGGSLATHLGMLLFLVVGLK